MCFLHLRTMYLCSYHVAFRSRRIGESSNGVLENAVGRQRSNRGSSELENIVFQTISKLRPRKHDYLDSKCIFNSYILLCATISDCHWWYLYTRRITHWCEDHCTNRTKFNFETKKFFLNSLAIFCGVLKRNFKKL